MIDILIAGGGIAGTLLAHRILYEQATKPPKIMLLEKESVIGGRLCSLEDGRWGYGTARLTSELFEFWDQTMKGNPRGKDLPQFGVEKCAGLGLLSANKLAKIDGFIEFSEKEASSVAGAVVGRDWKNFTKLVQLIPEKSEHSFGQLWPGDRKSPAISFLDNLAMAQGITDLWSCRLDIFKERVMRRADLMGQWGDALRAMIA